MTALRGLLGPCDYNDARTFAPGARTLSTDKTIRQVTDPEQQQADTYRYWQSMSVGERLSAVWDLSAAAYGFAEDFKESASDDARRVRRTITRVQRSRR